MRLASDSTLVLACKGGAAVAQLLLLVLTARWFGVEFRGEVALFNATLQLLVLLVGFTGGISIAFLAARDADRRTLDRLLALGWAAALVLPPAALAVANALGWSAGPRVILLGAIAVLQALHMVHLSVLVAGQAAWKVSLLEFLRPAAIVGLLLGARALGGTLSPDGFYAVWFAGTALAFVLSLPFVAAHRGSLPGGAAAPRARGRLARDLVTHGSLAQASNVAQFLNYRWLFFALERHAGLSAVGLFSTAVAFAEVLWIPTHSLAAVALNRVTRAAAEPATRALVLRLVRLAVVAMVLASALALVLPLGLVTGLLGRDFADVRALLARLLPGVVAMGVASVAASYHAGHGRYGRNLAAALAGLAITSLGFTVLIPRFEVAGAVVAMNAAHLLTAAVVLAPLVVAERVRALELVPRLADLRVRTGEPR